MKSSKAEGQSFCFDCLRLQCFVTFLSLIAVECYPQASTTRTSPSRIVATRYGRLQGSVVSLPSPLAAVEVFQGIPYATPPLGINRFSPTRNPVPWSGIKIADRNGPACPQRFPNLVNDSAVLKWMSKARRDHLQRIEQLLSNQSEDCLYLNIYAPVQGRPPDLLEKLPVLVFIHGESFEWGAGHVYDPSIFASYAHVVVITLNFRLGVLGFLNLGRWPKGKPRLANYGLMDQVAALHWVRENIAEFGGDPDRVTLVGHGTGAACVHFLMTSPTVVPGLFHRGILISGSALAPWALVNDANEVAVQVSQAAGCVYSASASVDPAERSEQDAILSCLRSVPLETLLGAASGIKERRFCPIFGPSVDGVVIRSDMSSGGPRKRSEDRNVYDLLFGTTGVESSYQLSDTQIESVFDSHQRDLLLRNFVTEAYRYHQTEIFLTLANEYTDWERTVQNEHHIRESTIEALSDGQYVAPAIALGDILTLPESKSYFYVMDLPSIQQQQQLKTQPFHGFEMSLLFGTALVSGLPHSSSLRNYSKQEMMYSEAMMTLFGNFARTGNPNEPQDASFRISKERNRFKGVTWETYDRQQRKFLEISSKPRMRFQFRAHRMAVWLQLLPELQRTGQHDVIQGHGILPLDDGAPSLPGWVNGSYVDLSRVREEPRDITCATPATPTAAPSTSNASTNASATATNTSQADSLADSNVYSTALSVTISIGCSLLILNVLTFAGLYYRRDRRRQAAAGDIKDIKHGSLMNFESGSSRCRTPASIDTESTVFAAQCNGGTSKSAINLQPCYDLDQFDVARNPKEPKGRSTLDVRFDTSIPIPPDKNFL